MSERGADEEPDDDDDFIEDEEDGTLLPPDSFGVVFRPGEGFTLVMPDEVDGSTMVPAEAAALFALCIRLQTEEGFLEEQLEWLDDNGIPDLRQQLVSRGDGEARGRGSSVPLLDRAPRPDPRPGRASPGRDETR